MKNAVIWRYNVKSAVLCLAGFARLSWSGGSANPGAKLALKGARVCDWSEVEEEGLCHIIQPLVQVQPWSTSFLTRLCTSQVHICAQASFLSDMHNLVGCPVSPFAAVRDSRLRPVSFRTGYSPKFRDGSWLGKAVWLTAHRESIFALHSVIFRHPGPTVL